MMIRLKEKIRIIIADDHPLICIALKKILGECDDIEVVAEVNNGKAAVQAAVELVPDIVILDISMPIINGLEATRLIKTRCPDVLVLVLTVHNDIEYIFNIFKAGADAYLTKSVLGEEVVQSIRGLIAGETILSPEIFKLVLGHALKYPIKSSPLNKAENLNIREQEILILASKGMSNKEISVHLNLRPSTVKSYFAELFSKLDVKSRTEAVITAIRSGIISINNSNE